MKKILVCGLPGSGKTTLAQQIKHHLEDLGRSVSWFNADRVRQDSNDWDFSDQGRLRQAHRMAKLAEDSPSEIVICDFVAPMAETRKIFQADITIWMDTISQSRYADTNGKFQPPENYNHRVTKFLSDLQVVSLANEIIKSDSGIEPSPESSR